MSDIRKIQTGNNQYTLHARVSDKLAVSTQIGSPTKPVYVDSNGEVRACSRDIPTVDSAISNSSTNAIQNKAVFDALKLKADAAALDKYQPKYNADYVATKDFNYSDVPEGINEVDLNGYTMSINVDNTISRCNYHNGYIMINSNKVELYGVFYNVSITSDYEFEQCKTGEGCNYMNCRLTNMLITADCELHNCTINSSVIETAYYIDSSKFYDCTFAASFNDDCVILNSVINGVTYHTPVIKNGKPTETGYESNIDSPTIPGNAPSCEAVKTALQLKADVSVLAAYQPKYKADYVAKEDLSELPITKGVLDLNGHSINASFSNQDGELTIQNGTILKIGEINAALNIINCTIERADVEAVNDYEVTFNYSNIKILFTDKIIYYRIFNSNVGYLACDCDTIQIYNSTVDELTCCTYGYNTVVICNSYISTINYDPTSQPQNDGSIYLYNCVFESLDLDDYPRNIYVQLCSCCDYANDVTYVNAYYDKTNGLKENVYTTIIENDNDLAPTSDAVYNALQLKADVSVLAAYQPKYKADYVATSDFDYSELPADANVIDLNGYTMTINVDPAGIEIYNGNVLVNGANVTFDGPNLYNVDIDGTTSYTIIDSCFYNCKIYRATVNSAGAEFNNCEVTGSNLTVMPFAISSKFYHCTFPKEDYTISCCCSVVIDGILYANPGIKNGKLIELNFESNIANPTIPGNAPSCEAVNAKFANYLTKTDANTTYAKKSDITNIYKFKGTKTNYANLPTTDRVTGDVWNITNADAEHGIKAGDNVAWNGTAWDNLSGTVDLSNYLLKGGKQTTTSTADGGSNVYTFTDGSTITVKNGSKGSTGVAATWFSGSAVTGTSTTAETFTVSGSKAGDMYLNTGTSNVYKATAANLWVYLCNIKGPQGTPGNNGTTPTIKAAAGGNIGAVGTPSVTANTSGNTTTFTFNNLKGLKGDTGATVTWHTGTAVTGTAATVAGAKTGDMYLNTKTYNVYKSTGTNKWVGVCNIKGAKGDAADIPKLAKGVAGIVPGTINDSLSASRWLNGGDNGTGAWRALPTAGGDTSGMVRTCKDYTGSINKDDIDGYAHGTTPPTLLPITSGASDYRGVESDGSGRLFVNVPAYEKNVNRAQNTVLAAPTSGVGTATFRKLTSSDIPWNERFKVMTPGQYKTATKLTNVFYFILEE